MTAQLEERTCCPNLTLSLMLGLLTIVLTLILPSPSLAQISELSDPPPPPFESYWLGSDLEAAPPVVDPETWHLWGVGGLQKLLDGLQANLRKGLIRHPGDSADLNHNVAFIDVKLRPLVLELSADHLQGLPYPDTQVGRQLVTALYVNAFGTLLWLECNAQKIVKSFSLLCA